MFSDVMPNLVQHIAALHVMLNLVQHLETLNHVQGDERRTVMPNLFRHLAETLKQVQGDGEGTILQSKFGVM
jgi:hypothetical protein